MSYRSEYTCVKIAFALDTRKRVAISFAAKLSAIDTTTSPAYIIAKYKTTAFTVIGMSIAIASPFENIASSAFATNLRDFVHYIKNKMKG